MPKKCIFFVQTTKLADKTECKTRVIVLWLRSQQLKQDSYIKCPLAGEIATASLKLKLNVLVDEFSAALFCNLKKYNSFDESW